jgi:hypothetical protein
MQKQEEACAAKFENNYRQTIIANWVQMVSEDGGCS